MNRVRPSDVVIESKRWKAKTFFFVTAAIATIIMAKNDFADIADWTVGMMHMPHTVTQMNNDMNNNFSRLDKRLGRIERANGIDTDQAESNAMPLVTNRVFTPAPVALGHKPTTEIQP